MSLRIYDISKKLGLENKDVIAKAKELGITQARVPSSMLDNVTAEYLEQQLRSSAQPPLTILQTPGPPGDSQPPMPLEDKGQASRFAGITIHTISPQIHNLVERILSGEVPFIVDVCREPGSPPLRVTLVEHEAPGTPTLAVPKPRPEPPLPREELDERTKYLFRAAYYAARQFSKDDWVNLAEYGSALKRLDPNFQPQRFGERSLGGLIRRMLDDFEIKTDGNTPPVYFIRMKPQVLNSQPNAQAASPVAPQSSQSRRQATGKIHNLKLGFGFIAPDDGGENVFFHSAEVVGCTIFDLHPGDPVEFELGVNERGPAAWKVKRLS